MAWVNSNPAKASPPFISEALAPSASAVAIHNNVFVFVSVHHLNLNVAIEAFDAHGLRGQNDKLLDVADMVTVLSSLYETIAAATSGASVPAGGATTAATAAVNVPLCLDLTLNWMLNIYDW